MPLFSDNADEYGEGIGALTKRADSVFMNVAVESKRTFLEYPWRRFFPYASYSEVTEYALKSIDVLAQVSEGSFHPSSMKETEDTPEIQFNLKKQVLPFFDVDSKIVISEDQLELFRMVSMDSNLSQVVGLVERKIFSANKVAGETHNKIFFLGNDKIGGILNNPFITDINSAVHELKNVIEWMGRAAMVAGQQTLQEVSTPVIHVSPTMAAYLNTYETGTDRSYLSKVEAIQISRNGISQTLRIDVLGFLEATVSSTKPYGDTLFVSDDSDDFFYAYKPLRFRPFRVYKEKSYSSLVEFAYTEPMAFKKYSINRAAFTAGA